MLLPPPLRSLPAGSLLDRFTHLSHRLPSTFSLQGQRPLWGSQVPRLPAGLQVQALSKRQDKRRVSNKSSRVVIAHPHWKESIFPNA